MGWLATITTFLGALNPYVAIFGTALGAIATYFVNQWVQRKQQEQQAEQQMNTDIAAHANDGQISVQDMDSALSQIQNLNQQASTLDQPQPTPGAKP